MIRALLRRHRSAVVPGAILVALLVLAVLAPLVAPYAFDALDLARRRGAPSLHHLFGTDELGRDLLTRILFGARISLAIGLVSAALSAAIGVTVGAAAGFAGGIVDAVLMRITDAMLSVPRLPLLMISAAVLEPSVLLLIALVGLVGWMETARVVRAEVQSIAARDFVTAARATGARTPRIVLRHILPGVVPTIAVALTLAVGRGILLESALSFFGVGVQPPTASWGNMLYQAQTTMSSEPWLGIFPGAFIFLTVLCCNLLATAVEPDIAVSRTWRR
ncbi:MAG TPA: ABC transporter permease [Gemmatimonadaceae bacterium]|nr:ABC transporter permease [Gemmatimonadaceae bacterium]